MGYLALKEIKYLTKSSFLTEESSSYVCMILPLISIADVTAMALKLMTFYFNKLRSLTFLHQNLFSIRELEYIASSKKTRLT